MSASLVICILGIVFYFGILVFYFVRLSSKKKNIKESGGKIEKANASYTSSLILCALVESLPLLIPLKTYVIVIVCLCGLLGESLVLRERLEKLGNKE